jgi:hypothetical protein
MSRSLSDTPLLASFGADVLGNGSLSVQDWLGAYLGTRVPTNVFENLVRRTLVAEVLEQVSLARASADTWSAFEKRLLRVSPAHVADGDALAQAKVSWEASHRWRGFDEDSPIEEAQEAEARLRNLLRSARRLLPAQSIEAAGHRCRRPRPRTVALRRFLASRDAEGTPWRLRLQRWNARYPEWRYSSPWTFCAHCRRAARRL